MVEIHSIAASSHPSRREQKTEGRLLLAPRQGDPVVHVVFLLLQVIILAMELRPHSLRLKVATIHQ
jgi:hypothetical protein